MAGAFSLVYLVFNTISNVTTQDKQVAVFCNAAAHLRPGGRFLIEVPACRICASAAARPRHCPVRGEPRRARGGELHRLRPVRHSHATVHLQPRHCVSRWVGTLPSDSLPLCVAGRDGSDGPHRGSAARAPLVRLGPIQFHAGEYQAHIRFGSSPDPTASSPGRIGRLLQNNTLVARHGLRAGCRKGPSPAPAIGKDSAEWRGSRR